jgi:hypothetical protein
MKPARWGLQQIGRLHSLPVAVKEEHSRVTRMVTMIFWAVVGSLTLIPSSCFALASVTIQVVTGKLRRRKCIIPQVEEKPKDNVLPTTDPRIVASVYRMCKDFDELATKYGIRYVAEGGTLLGIFRHKGFIPWDDDADLQLMLGEETKLANPAFLKDLEAKGLKLALHWGGWKLCPIKYPSYARAYERGSPERNFCWPFVDIFVAKLDPERPDHVTADLMKHHVSTKEAPADWSSWDFFTLDQLQEIKRAAFGPVELNIPTQCEEYLDRAYRGWREEARITFDHATAKPVDPPIVVKKTDFVAAKYDEKVFSDPV